MKKDFQALKQKFLEEITAEATKNGPIQSEYELLVYEIQATERARRQLQEEEADHAGN